MSKRISNEANNTVECWICPKQMCGYTFEMRQSARGFNYCFEQERELTGGRSSRQASPGGAHDPLHGTSSVGSF